MIRRLGLIALGAGILGGAANPAAADGIDTFAGSGSFVVIGKSAEAVCGANNENLVRPARTWLEASITWSDGSVLRFTGLSGPYLLQPAQGVVLFINYVVPPTAPVGPAVLTCLGEARDGDAATWDVGTDGFLVVAP